MTPPCKKNGAPCPERRTGCHETCEAYRPYREVMELAKKDRERNLLLCAYTENTWRAKSARTYRKMIGKG